MNSDATGHGARDAGHALRTAAPHLTPDTRTASVPLPVDAWEGGNGYGTQDALRDGALDPRDVPRVESTVPPTRHNRGRRDTTRPERDVPLDDKPGMVARFKAYRERTALDAELRDAERHALQAQRDITEQSRRDTAARAATASRKAYRDRRDATVTAEDIAPVPDWMKVFGAWAGRVFGEMPIVAPLLVSGAFTGWAFASVPMPVPGWVRIVGAILAALALEGGLWKSIKTYVATLLNNDSTIGIRLVIGLYLVTIAAVIAGHAYVLAWDAAAELGGEVTASAVFEGVQWTAWVPAGIAALMGTFGVLVASKDARLRYRTRLIQLELVDKRVPKFSAASWMLCLPSTWSSLRHAVKYRIESPIEATDDWRLWKATGRPDIWPVPPGFRYVKGELVEVPVAERDTTMQRDTISGTPGRRTAQDAGTPNGAGRGTSRGTVPSRTAGHDGTRDAGQNAGHAGTAGTGNGTIDPDDHGTQDADGTRDADGTGDDTGDFADVLKYIDYLWIVTEAFGDWRVKTPSVRGIKTAINDHKVQTEEGTFGSMDIAGKVQRQVDNLRRRPELLSTSKYSTAATAAND